MFSEHQNKAIASAKALLLSVGLNPNLDDITLLDDSPESMAFDSSTTPPPLPAALQLILQITVIQSSIFSTLLSILCKNNKETCKGLKVSKEIVFNKTLSFYCAMKETGCLFDSINVNDYCGDCDSDDDSDALEEDPSGKTLFPSGSLVREG
ncbi:hypothetical protein BDQ17DRAFT_1436653 [Cyathus striatus]|nr:hypothetical protein BDQ17DRAFT_1436653 [Cyathus striatus]